MLGTALFACSLIAGLGSAPQTSPANAQTSQTQLLRVLLNDYSRKTGLQVIAIPFLGGELVPNIPADQVTVQNLEDTLKKLVAKMSMPARIIKLNLPKGPKWTPEELLAYARAESALFRKQVPDMRTDYLEIMGNSFTKEQAQPAVEALGLQPVYVIALKGAFFGGTWDTTYGRMRLTQNGNRITGTYETNSGVIEGVVDGNVMRLSWYEQSNGSSGSAVYTLSDDAMSFSGPWYNSTDWERSAGVWAGTRVRG
jgi:hypothetical protein